jgi:hypothetical protein
MSGSVPRLPWRRAAPVLLTAICLVAACSAVAADNGARVTAKPLWDAYPLDTGPPTATAEAGKASTAPQATTTAAPSLVEPEQQDSAPVAVLVLFYSAIAGLLIGVAVLGMRQLRRSRTARTPTGASHG